MELFPHGFRCRPVQLGPVLEKPQPQGVQPGPFDVGVGDGLDALLREEGEAGKEEGGHLRPVIRNRALEEEDLVGQAANFQLRVPGQGLQPPVDDPGEVSVGRLQLDLQAPDGVGGLPPRSEEGRGAQAIRLRDPGVPDGGWSDHGGGGVLPLLPPRDVDLGGDPPQGNVPPLLAGAESDQGGVGQPEHGLAGEEPQVQAVSLEGVFQVADLDLAGLGPGDDGEKALGPGVQESLGLGHDLRLEDAEVPEEPPGYPDPHTLHLHLHIVLLVQLFDDLGEVLLDVLPVEGPLGRQLPQFRVEVPVQHGEVHHPLVGGQVVVGGGDDLLEVLVGGFGADAVLQDRVLQVGNDEKDVVVLAVAHHEAPCDARNVGQLLLDGPWGHRLPLGVLVDVLDPVDDLVISAFPLPKDVAGGKPVVPIRVGGRIPQVAGHVVPGDLELSFGADPGLQPRQGNSHRVVLVGSRRGHGDSPRRLRHPESAAELHPVPLEKMEGRRFQGPRRRETPAETVSHHAPEGGGTLGLFPRGIHCLQALLLDLLPATGDGDEAGGPDPLQPCQQGFQGRVSGEDVGTAPEEHSRHLQVPPEGVVEGEKGEEDLVLSHLRQGRRPGESLGDQAVDGVLDPFGPARAAGGEHDRGQIGDAPAWTPGQGVFDLRFPQACHGRTQVRLPGSCQNGIVIQEIDLELGPGSGPEALNPGSELVGLHHYRVDLQGVEDPGQILLVEVRVQGCDQDVIGQTGQVGAGSVQGVFGKDGHPRLVVGKGPEYRGHGPDSPSNGLVGPGSGLVFVHLLEEGPLRMGPGPLLQERFHPEVQVANDREGGFGPSVAGLRVRQGQQKGALPGLVQVPEPDGPFRFSGRFCPRKGLAGQESLGGLQQGEGLRLGSGPFQPTLKARLESAEILGHSARSIFPIRVG